MPERYITDDINAYLDKHLPSDGRSVTLPNASGSVRPMEEPTPSPSPDASPDASASPEPSPVPVFDVDVLQAVQQVQVNAEASRVASAGSFMANCLIVMLLVALVLFTALRRR